VTYRTGAHSSSDDPTAYRDNAEVEEAQKRDPVRRMRRYLERVGGWSEAQQAAAEARIHAELSACIEKAEAAPAPSIASMFEDVYEHMPAHLIEQQAECVSGPRTRKRH
jgi:TPP-dependent pyruvate/acetoin dehydrogenase alpha subunit